MKGITARAGDPGLKWSPGWLLTTFSTCEEQEHQGRACHSHFTELTEPERRAVGAQDDTARLLQTGTLAQVS